MALPCLEMPKEQQEDRLGDKLSVTVQFELPALIPMKKNISNCSKCCVTAEKLNSQLA
jgi:hypothetical protein